MTKVQGRGSPRDPERRPRSLHEQEIWKPLRLHEAQRKLLADPCGTPEESRLEKAGLGGRGPTERAFRLEPAQYPEGEASPAVSQRGSARRRDAETRISTRPMLPQQR